MHRHKLYTNHYENQPYHDEDNYDRSIKLKLTNIITYFDEYCKRVDGSVWSLAEHYNPATKDFKLGWTILQILDNFDEVGPYVFSYTDEEFLIISNEIAKNKFAVKDYLIENFLKNQDYLPTENPINILRLGAMKLPKTQQLHYMRLQKANLSDLDKLKHFLNDEFVRAPKALNDLNRGPITNIDLSFEDVDSNAEYIQLAESLVGQYIDGFVVSILPEQSDISKLTFVTDITDKLDYKKANKKIFSKYKIIGITNKLTKREKRRQYVMICQIS